MWKAWLVALALFLAYGLVGEAEYKSLEAMQQSRVQLLAEMSK